MILCAKFHTFVILVLLDAEIVYYICKLGTNVDFRFQVACEST